VEPGPEALEVDVAIVGAGPAGLSVALELARLGRENGSPWRIAIFEKAAGLGEHSLSGAIVKPVALRALFPDLPVEDLPFREPVRGEKVYLLGPRRAWRIPTPPTMRNRGNYIASICEIVRWMGARAEERGVDVFAGFPVESLLVRDDRVVGLRTRDFGVGRDGQPRGNHQPGAEVRARITVLAEGSRGMLSQAWLAWQKVASPNPQIYALGVKELWETPNGARDVIHTLGWPLDRRTFGGSFIYPMGEGLTALGLVVGLDYPALDLDVHGLLQKMKLHSFVRPLLEGGKLLEWGAKTIPEGGLLSLPSRLSGEGIVLVGDSAGFVDVPSLKGIHYAMHSGLVAARTLHRALTSAGPCDEPLAAYDAEIRRSYICQDLWRTRTMRLGFKRGFWRGTGAAGIATVTRGRWPRAPGGLIEDAAHARAEEHVASATADRRLTFSKVDAVFHSGNNTADDIPSHLIAPAEPPPEAVRFYSAMCPAGVYEAGPEGQLVISAPNCIDCKATDVLGPRWTPREAGSGPAYRSM
jgi:electron-transferring-flavoprotein dehydrogenase